ncbi:MAG: hypothetical protein PHX61_03320 [Alphaproteobacteria bacterium]|nr:hypothetical protein [Alphaproteobacteria bacterium]
MSDKPKKSGDVKKAYGLAGQGCEDNPDAAQVMLLRTLIDHTGGIYGFVPSSSVRANIMGAANALTQYAPDKGGKNDLRDKYLYVALSFLFAKMDFIKKNISATDIELFQGAQKGSKGAAAADFMLIKSLENLENSKGRVADYIKKHMGEAKKEAETDDYLVMVLGQVSLLAENKKPPEDGLDDGAKPLLK